MAAIPANNLGVKVTELETLRGEILAAVDLLITGIWWRTKSCTDVGAWQEMCLSSACGIRSYERVYRHAYDSVSQARVSITDYLDWYNHNACSYTQVRHSDRDCRNPGYREVISLPSLKLDTRFPAGMPQMVPRAWTDKRLIRLIPTCCQWLKRPPNQRQGFYFNFGNYFPKVWGHFLSLSPNRLNGRPSSSRFVWPSSSPV